MPIKLKEIGQRIERFFKGSIEKVAKETKFVQRASKLTGTKFLQALVFANLEQKSVTLSSISQSCLDLGVEISAQGVDERMNEQSVAFMKRMFSQAIKHFQMHEPLAIRLLQQFTAVYLVDSSQISLPASMAEQFPGSGGNSSVASLKIQLVFDYLDGHLEQVEFCNGCEPDQSYRGYHALIHEGVLLLMDLGYFVLDSLKVIEERKGYFLSRFLSQTALFTTAGERLDLAALLAAQTENCCEIEVLIGSRQQHHIPTRLIMLRLSQEAADRQRQKAKDNAQRHGRSLSQDYLKLLDWALFITNIPEPMLHTRHVASLYRIRWQIELVFKMCKSFFALDSVAALRCHRLMTELYARLIGVVLTYFLIAPVRLPDPLQQNREISPTKVRLIFQRFARQLTLTLYYSAPLLPVLDDFFRHVFHAGFKQKRRKKPNAIHSLALISACYDWPLDPAYSLFDSLSA